MSAESKLLSDTAQLIRIIHVLPQNAHSRVVLPDAQQPWCRVPQRAGQTICFLLSGFIVLKAASPFRAKTYDTLRSRRFISNSGRAATIKGSCRISGESDDQFV
jgi:hypothetical protein